MTEYLYHYYERETGPFRNLSALPLAEARAVMDTIKTDNQLMASHRYDGYLERRHELEHLARSIFEEKGGKPILAYPHYMIIGKCDWLQSWYKDGVYIRILLSDFSPETISFSYGDLFPTFSDRVTDEKEYRKQVYTLSEIIEIIGKFGLPQAWNADGRFGPERYVEAQIWDYRPLKKFLSSQ